MDLEGDSNAGTSAGFLHQLHWRHFGPLKLIRDNTPGTHRPRRETVAVQVPVGDVAGLSLDVYDLAATNPAPDASGSPPRFATVRTISPYRASPDPSLRHGPYPPENRRR